MKCLNKKNGYVIHFPRTENDKISIQEVFGNVTHVDVDIVKDIHEITMPINTFNSDWLAIPFMYKNRMKLLTFLEENNIQTRVCFAGNVTRHPAYREYFTVFPNSDEIMSDGFLLGAHHGMTIDDVDYICDKIKEFLHL